MFCSIVVPTIGRASVSRTVQSLLDQTFTAADFEIIVVNDSRQPLPAMAWQESPRVQVITTNRRERCVARNAGAATAKGRYLCFLDDDDWLLPEALTHFWQLASQAPEAVWLYGGLQVVDEAGAVLAEANSGLQGNCFAQIMGGAWAPIQASFLQTRTFFLLGGYDPAIIGTEDLDLCRRFALQGDFANTPAAVACLLRGATWETSTNYLRAPADTLRSRDNVFAQPGAFSRLVASANSAYWSGRMVRVYVSTIRYNLRRQNYFTAASRTAFALAATILSAKHLFSKSFWAGLKADHPPGTLHFIQKKLEQEAAQNGPSLQA